MEDFVDRYQELKELNELAERPQSQFLTVYGRRRVGKTTLLLHWAQQNERPYIYWMARRGETAASARQHLAEIFWQWAYPDDEEAQPPQFGTWPRLFDFMVRILINANLLRKPLANYTHF